MTTRFAGTYFHLALLDDKEQHHARVTAGIAEQEDALVTTRWVLAEVANALAGSAFRSTVAAFLEQLDADPGLKIVGPSDALYRRDPGLCARRADKTWSLTDWVSFVVMEEEGLREALTGDRHFAPAGWVPVFADE